MGGSLNQDEIDEIKSRPKFQGIRYFVETGTYKGDTTILAATNYEHIYTTEIHPVLYKDAVHRMEVEGVENVTMLLGDSVELLSEIVPKVQEGAVYYLDAHLSGSDSAFNGKDQVPMIQELEVILDGDIERSVIVCDDLRLWSTEKAWDWAHITTRGIVKMIVDRGYTISSFYERNDRLWVFVEGKEEMI
jgi:hypothetical protein